MSKGGKISKARPQWSKWPKFVSLHYWRAPRGDRGVKKSGLPNWSPLWWVGVPRFSQNWRNCEKPSKLNKNCQRNLFFLEVFWILFNLGWILALQLTKVVFSLVFQIFWHPWHPWGRVNSGDIIVLRFVFDILYRSAIWRLFSLFKLKPNITCIDLTSRYKKWQYHFLVPQWLNL